MSDSSTVRVVNDELTTVIATGAIGPPGPQGDPGPPGPPGPPGDSSSGGGIITSPNQLNWEAHQNSQPAGTSEISLQNSAYMTLYGPDSSVLVDISVPVPTGEFHAVGDDFAVTNDGFAEILMFRTAGLYCCRIKTAYLENVFAHILISGIWQNEEWQQFQPNGDSLSNGIVDTFIFPILDQDVMKNDTGGSWMPGDTFGTGAQAYLYMYHNAGGSEDLYMDNYWSKVM